MLALREIVINLGGDRGVLLSEVAVQRRTIEAVG